MAKHHWQIERELLKRNKQPGRSFGHSRAGSPAYVTRIESPDPVYDPSDSTTKQLRLLGERAEAANMKITKALVPNIQEDDNG